MTTLGAEDYVDRSTVELCLEFCIDDMNCAGVDVDYNRNPKRCWPHRNRVNFIDSNIYSQRGTTSYELVTRCATDVTTTPPTKS